MPLVTEDYRNSSDRVFNLSVSEGAIANLLEVAKNRLNQSVEEITSRLHQSKLVCSDETGARVKGKNF